MIHRSVAKLQRYLDDPAFESVMNELEAGMLEGYDFKVETHRLEDEARLDLIQALFALGYDVESPEDGELYVSISG